MIQVGEHLQQSAHVDAWLVRRLRASTLAPPPRAAGMRAAAYFRVSTAGQAASLENQKRDIAAFAKREGFEIVAAYEDAGTSGLTLRKRSGLSRLLADVVTGNAPFDHILVLDVSRWGRFQDPDEAAHYEFVCRAHGVAVIYCRDQIVGGPQGQLVKQVKRVMAADVSRQLSDGTRRGKRRAAEAGRAPGNWPRYMAARRVIDPDGAEGPVLRCGEFRFHPLQSLRLVPAADDRVAVVGEIFRMFTTGGRSMADIAAALSRDGVTWMDGTPFTRRRVARILRQTLAIGVQSCGRTRTELGVRRPEGDASRWGAVQVFAPLVPVAMFEAAQARFGVLAGRLGYTDAEMIAGLRPLLAREGKLSAALVDACPDIPGSRRYETRFGTLTEAWRMAGYERPAVWRGATPGGKPLSRAAVLRGLQRLMRETGGLNIAAIQADRRLPSISMIRKMFGSVSAASRSAGLS